MRRRWTIEAWGESGLVSRHGKYWTKRVAESDVRLLNAYSAYLGEGCYYRVVRA